ncbi:Flp family type IVb pilin [bacterium]|nr:Flp family type IVb pilin [bacterium]PIZ26485.1 MAG: Flp family type IVb pilin [Chloroflexi bacterium CG_4_10_14_0_8_um_filter_57_5]
MSKILSLVAKNATTFVRDERGQDFAEYALLLGAVGVVAIAVIAAYKGVLRAAFQAGINALRAAAGG